MGEVLLLHSSLASPSRACTTRVKLTEERIRSLRAPAHKPTYTYDAVIPHLAVRVTPTSARTFVVVKKVNGKAQRITLGRFPGLRLEDARQAATAIAGELAQGKDPIASRKAARARRVRLVDLWPAYLAHLKRHNRTWNRDVERWEKQVRPAIGRKALSEITRTDCQALVDRIGVNHTIAANRVAAFLSALFGFAVRTDQLVVNPAKGLTRFQETARARVIKSHEAPVLLDAIEAENEPWASVFKMLVYTGARRGSIAQMRWEDVDLITALWTIPANIAKNKTTTQVPLTTEAVELLNERQKQHAGEPWVFPSSTGSGHLVGLPKAWARILKRAGITNLRIHDIRRSVGTALARTGASPHVIATGLGHRSIASSKAYVRLAGEDAREALGYAVASMTGGSKLNG
jgi:integrase